MDDQSKILLSGLYAEMLQKVGGYDPLGLDPRCPYWVMDLGSYKAVRAASLAAGAVYPPDEQDPETWVPKPGDRLFGLPVEVREDGGAPHVNYRY